MSLFFNWKIILLILIWIAIFVLAIKFLPRIKSPIAKSINPMMVLMPISFILSDQIISNNFYFSYLIYFLIAWLIIGLVMFLFSVRQNGQTTVQQFWLTYWRASSLIAVIFLILSVILVLYRLFVG